MNMKKRWIENKPTEKELAGLPKNIRKRVEGMYDIDKPNRHFDVITLGNLKNPLAIPFLAKAIEDGDLNFRYFVVQALSEIGHKDAIPHLVKVIEKEHIWNIKINAVKGLGNTNHPKALPHLIKATKPGRLISATAKEEMLKITHPDAIPVFASFLVEEKKDFLPAISEEALDNIKKKMFEKTPKPTPKFAHYPFTLIDYKQHPKAFAAFCKEFFDPKNRGRDDTYWRAYAGQLKAASTSDGLK